MPDNNSNQEMVQMDNTQVPDMTETMTETDKIGKIFEILFTAIEDLQLRITKLESDEQSELKQS